MKGIVIWIVASIAALVLLGTLAFGAEWAGLAWKGYFKPKHAAVEREVFMETRSFNQAVITALADHRLEWIREEDPIAKNAILATVRLQYGEYDESKLTSPELISFLKTAKYGKSNPGF